jgi:hypothetical protein
MSTAVSENSRYMNSDAKKPRLEEEGLRYLNSSNYMIARMTDKLAGYLTQRPTSNTLEPSEDLKVTRPSFMPSGTVQNQLTSTSYGWSRPGFASSSHDIYSTQERLSASRIAQIDRKIQQAQAENLLMQRLAKSDKELLLTNYATRIRYFNEKAAHRYFQDNYIQGVPRMPVRAGPVAGLGGVSDCPQTPWHAHATQNANEQKQLNRSLTNKSTSQVCRSESKLRSRSRLDDKSWKDRKSVKSNHSSKSKSTVSRSGSRSRSKSGALASKLRLKGGQSSSLATKKTLNAKKKKSVQPSRVSLLTSSKKGIPSKPIAQVIRLKKKSSSSHERVIPRSGKSKKSVNGEVSLSGKSRGKKRGVSEWSGGRTAARQSGK